MPDMEETGEKNLYDTQVEDDESERIIQSEKKSERSPCPAQSTISSITSPHLATESSQTYYI